MKGVLANDYEILAIMGIEMSPACAINYQYSNKGMMNVPGVFMGYLMQMVSELDVEIPFIGINRKYVRKSLEKLREVIEGS